MRTTTGTRVKVFFFTIVLSRSRFKYVWFTDRYFTSELAIEAHEKAFEYIGGIPDEIVYDQDKVFVVSENGGDIILTNAFRGYTRAQCFDLYFCRKADPQSKGKVENVVKYVKQNFLYNRTYHNIETLNDEVLGWLGRTANSLPHGTLVAVRVEDDAFLVITDALGEEQICRHKIPVGRGNKVANTDHKRDKSAAIGEMIAEVAALFEHPEKAREWLEMIKADKPRYIRDQLIMIRQAALQTASAYLNKAMEYCLSHKICSAADFKSILASTEQFPKKETKIVRLNPLSGEIPDKANIQPQKSSIEDFEQILKKS